MIKMRELKKTEIKRGRKGYTDNLSSPNKSNNLL